MWSKLWWKWWCLSYEAFNCTNHKLPNITHTALHCQLKCVCLFGLFLRCSGYLVCICSFQISDILVLWLHSIVMICLLRLSLTQCSKLGWFETMSFSSFPVAKFYTSQFCMSGDWWASIFVPLALSGGGLVRCWLCAKLASFASHRNDLWDAIGGRASNSASRFIRF